MDARTVCQVSCSLRTLSGRRHNLHTTLAVAVVVLLGLGASHRTPNFVVEASTPDFARAVGDAAEQLRRDLAVEWLGQALPNWSQPCPVRVTDGEHLGAGGATSFVFSHGEVFGWDMQIQGSRRRVLDSVLPHEVTHTVFASHFRQALPRWADEGACTTVEHPEEKSKQEHLLIEFLQSGRGIPFSRMFAMKDYPADILPLYSQGYSLARYLIAQGGQRKFITFLGDGLQSGHWLLATRQHYGYDSLAALQDSWLGWVRQGSPAMETPPGAEPGLRDPIQLAASRRTRPESNLIYRGQPPTPWQQGLSRLLPNWRRSTDSPPTQLLGTSSAPRAGYEPADEQRPAARPPSGVTANAPEATAGSVELTSRVHDELPGPGSMPRLSGVAGRDVRAGLPGGTAASPRATTPGRQVIAQWSREPVPAVATSPGPSSPRSLVRRATLGSHLPTAALLETSPTVADPIAPPASPLLFDAPPRHPESVLR